MRPSLLCFLTVAACSRPAPPPSPPPSPARIAELVAIMSRQGDTQLGHGEYHRPRADLERELWRLVNALPAVEKGDELLLLVVQNVYTRYDKNYWNGYLWHWPYLNSRRAIALVDRLLALYPKSAVIERALWLKAFALRCPPAPPMHEAEEEFDFYRDQTTWAPQEEAARRVLQAAARLGGPYAGKSKALAESVELSIILPVDALSPDPRDPE